MDVKDVPSDMLEKVRLSFESNPQVRQLRTKQQYFQSVGKYRESLELAKTLEELYTVVLHSYLEKAEKEAIVMDTETADIPKADKNGLMENLMVIFMACDMIESAITDFNDILHRSKPGVDLSVFTDMRQLSEMARTKLKYLQSTGDYMKDLVWAETCDNMYDMMHNKARSIMRKRKESKDWGKNMEKFYKS